MRLPDVHERVFIVQEAAGIFGMKTSELSRKHNRGADETIQVYSQCIVNLTLENKVYFNDFQRDIEKVLEEVAEEYQLSYGEKVKLLTEKISSEAKYVIRWERHKDVSREGDLEYSG
jgi:hypothetical protein